WNTSTNTDSRIEFTELGEEEGTTSGQLENTKEHQITLYNLTPGTSYQLTVYSKDQFGNESSSEDHQFTTEEDNNPPQIDNIKSETTVIPGK
nr:fibronectin type III domain-containing protein [Patescibacteria group bacterium]